MSAIKEPRPAPVWLPVGVRLAACQLDARYWRLISFFAPPQIPPRLQLYSRDMAWPWMSSVMHSMN